MINRMWIVALALVAAACAGNRPPPVIPQPVIIYGLGVDVGSSEDDKPIEGARVEIREGPSAGLNATSDGNGNVPAFTLPPAIYSVCASAGGFAERCVGVDLQSGNQHVGIDLDRLQQPPPDPVEPSGGCRVFGQLRLEPGGGFVDDVGPVLPRYWHYGDAFSRWARGQQAEVSADLDLIKLAGWCGIRTWTTLGEIHGGHGGGFWAGRAVGPQWTPQYWDHLRTFLIALKVRGLTVHLALGDIRPEAVPDRAQYARDLSTVVQEIGPNVVALFETANESRDTGGGHDVEASSEALARFATVFKQQHPGVLIGLSAFTGTEDVSILNAFSRPPADLFLVHGFRDNRWWDRIRHIFSLRYEGKPAKRIGWQGEPFGPGVLVSASQNKHENDDAVMTGAAAMALMTRQAWVGFSGPGVISDCQNGEVINPGPRQYVCNGERMQDMAGFWSTPKVAAMLPADVMRYDEFIHGGDTWRHKRVFVASGENRADHALYRDGRFVCIIYGEHIDAVQPQAGVEFETYIDTRLGNKVRIVVGKVVRRQAAAMPAVTSLPWAA
jgi:hypothetical protein